jgi:polygalacturonase
MKRIAVMSALIFALCLHTSGKQIEEKFPDGTSIPAWFGDTETVDINALGKKYVITDYGVKNDSTIVQTEAIQRVIDMAAKNGGGVIVVPEGTFLTGSLFFKQGTHLHIYKDGVIKGIDDISYYPIRLTRMEGQTLKYFSALVNADGLNGFTISGSGTINGNGLRFWREFWIRREIDKDCTNLEAMRPRLLYISNCKDVTVCGVRTINSGFWTNHVYRSQRVKFLNVYIYAPTSGVKAPSSDAIDIDNCSDVLVHGCYMSVNDDAVVLKGGKGVWADKDPNNGPNSNIIIENCRYGVVHACLTLGSESLQDRNVILRNIEVHNANRLLWLKMRPDTPQNYEYVTVENITGDAKNIVYVYPWTQFFKSEKRDDMPRSKCSNIILRNIRMSCDVFYAVKASDKYKLQDFTFENIDVKADKADFDQSLIENISVKNVKINGVRVKAKK